MTLLATVLIGWLLAASTHSPIAALLALFVPFAVNFGDRDEWPTGSGGSSPISCRTTCR